MSGTITRLTQKQIAKYEEYGQGCGQTSPVSESTCKEKVTHCYDFSEAGGRQQLHYALCDKHTAEALKMGAQFVNEGASTY